VKEDPGEACNMLKIQKGAAPARTLMGLDLFEYQFLKNAQASKYLHMPPPSPDNAQEWYHYNQRWAKISQQKSHRVIEKPAARLFSGSYPFHESVGPASIQVPLAEQRCIRKLLVDDEVKRLRI
jgi:hypothetical protein